MSLERFNDKEGVLVIGAGPAGSTAAAALARSGVEVLLVDKSPFPRPKVCGDGIGPLALECVREAGFDLARFGKLHPRIEHVGLVSPGGSRWRARYEASPDDPEGLDYGHVIARGEFDQALLDHALSCGAGFEPETAFAGLERAREWTTRVILRRGAKEYALSPRAILAADGEFSPVRRALTGTIRKPEGLAVRGYVEGLRRIPQDLEFYFSPEVSPGYSWIFPLGRPAEGRANVGLYAHRRTLARSGRSLKEHFEEFLAREAATGGLLEGARPCSAPQGYPITAYDPRRRVLFGNTLLLGDAAGLADLLTGEGIFPAAYSGLAAAWAVRASLDAGDAGDLGEYPALLARVLLPIRRRGLLLCWLLEHLPAFADWIFACGARDPILSGKLFAVVSGNAPLSRLFSPALWARLYLPGLFTGSRRALEGR